MRKAFPNYQKVSSMASIHEKWGNIDTDFNPVKFLSARIKTCGRNRSSRAELLLKKGVLKICRKFTGEHPCRSVISTNRIVSDLMIPYTTHAVAFDISK